MTSIKLEHFRIIFKYFVILLSTFSGYFLIGLFLGGVGWFRTPLILYPFVFLFSFFWIALIWYLVCDVLKMYCGRNKNEVSTTNGTDKFSELLEQGWFIILNVGLLFVLGKHFYSEIIKGSYTFSAYVNSIAKEEIYALFSMLMATMLVDFLMNMFQALSKVHENMYNIKSEFDQGVKILNQSSKTLTEKATQIDTVQTNVGAVVDKITNIDEDLKQTKDLLGGINSTLRDVSNNLFMFGKDVGFQTDIAEAFELKDILVQSFTRNSLEVREKIFKAIINYKDAKGELSLINKNIADSFISKFLQNFTSEQAQHKVDSNFGVLSQIVAMLFSKCDEFYMMRDKKNDIKIVYFTTVTMPPLYYLNPEYWAPNLPSVQDLWNNYRKQTRNYSCPDNDKTQKQGFMLYFKNNEDKFAFRRVMMVLKQGEIQKKGKQRFAIDEFNANWKNSTELVGDKGFLSVPQEFDQARNGVIDAPDSSCMAYRDFANRDLLMTPAELFESMYHPSIHDCTYAIISREKIQEIVKKNPQVFENAFDDPDWKSIIAGFSTNNEAVKNEQNGKDIVEWHEVFFNNHIPIDITAIGVMKKNDRVEWLGCISGYVGSDFSSMKLGWHDKYIASKEWEAISLYIDSLYTGDASVTKDTFWGQAKPDTLEQKF